MSILHPSPNLNPSPAQVLAIMRLFKVPVRLYRGWDTKGRDWRGPGGSQGLMGVVIHHTATAAAGNAPSLQWCATAYSKPAANWLVGRDGTSWLLAAGSCWHSGNGGPWPAIGVPIAGNVGHFSLAGVEIEDPGRGDTITAEQQSAVARICAAYQWLAGWGWERVITHGDWTDAGKWLTDHAGAPSPKGPYVGRKIDTLRAYYPARFWRDKAHRAGHELGLGGHEMRLG